MTRLGSRWAGGLLVAAAVAGFAAGCGGGGGGGGKTNILGGNQPPGGGPAPTGTVMNVGQLASGRVGHTATMISNGALAGKVLIAGGKVRSGSTDVVTNTVELYDPATGQFAVLRNTMTAARMNHAAMALPTGDVLIVGGQSDTAGTQPLATCERFSAANQSFVAVSGTLADPKARPVLASYTAAGVTEVIIAGGAKFMTSQTETVRSANIYKADSQTIIAASSLIQARAGASAAAIPGTSTIVVVGGFEKTQQTANQERPAGFETFDTTAKTFRNGTPANSQLTTNRSEQSIGLLGTDVVAIGGKSAQNQAIDTVEIYSPQSNAWTTVTARMAAPRFAAAAASFSGGIFVAGGTGVSGALNSTEIVSGSGVTASIAAGPQLQTARSGATATALQSGAILVVGGADASGVPVAQAEVFVPQGVQAPTVTPPPAGAAPTITSLNPTSGAIGSTVHVLGSNFGTNPANIVVKFNGVAAPVTNALTSDLTVLVPAGATTGPVSVTANGTTVTGPQFTVTSTTTPGTGGGGTGGGGTGGGGQFSGAPRIFVVLPTAAPAFIPIAIGGSNFAAPTVPYVNGMPSIALFNWSTQNLPLIGSISVGVTIVPPAAIRGAGDVKVEYFGQMSNPFPFTVN